MAIEGHVVLRGVEDRWAAMALRKVRAWESMACSGATSVLAEPIAHPHDEHEVQNAPRRRKP